MASRGVLVTPVEVRGKSPRVGGVGWQNNATTNEIRIDKWNDENPDYNSGCCFKAIVGTPCALDVDSGMLIEQYETETGEKWPETFTVTGGKGWPAHHAYFTHTAQTVELGNFSQGGLFDFRANDTIVVGPGSVHPSGAEYTIKKDLPFLPAPVALFAWLAQFRERSGSEHKGEKSDAPEMTPEDAAADVQSKRQTVNNILARSKKVKVLSDWMPYRIGRKLGAKKYVLCPWWREHTTDTTKSSAAIIVLPGLGLDFKCWHGHCLDTRGWKEFAAAIEEPLDFNDPAFPLIDAREVQSDETGTHSPLISISETGDEIWTPSVRALYTLTDSGNAERLAAYHGGRFYFCAERKAWFLWSGKNWQDDTLGRVEMAALDVARRIRAEAKLLAKEAEQEQDEEKREAKEELAENTLSWAKASESDDKQRAMVNRARIRPEFAVSISRFDQDPMLFNLQNCTVDLNTGALRAHDPKDMQRHISPVLYDAEAKCPLWLKCLDRWQDGNHEMINFLARATGYSLTGSIEEHAMFLLYGDGRNGKSKFLNAIFHVLGSYADSLRMESLLHQEFSSIPVDMAKLPGKRYVVAAESDKEVALAEAKIKRMTGGDPITARFMRENEFTYTPQFKLWLGTNHKPQIRGTDEAVWSRLKVVPFEVFIPEPERDKQLEWKLQQEAAGILNWMLSGLAQYREVGLDVPQKVKDATASYRADEDIVVRFTEEMCAKKKEGRAGVQKTFDEFSKWAEGEGRKKPLSRRDFRTRLEVMGYPVKDFNNGAFFIGIELKGWMDETDEKEEM